MNLIMFVGLLMLVAWADSPDERWLVPVGVFVVMLGHAFLYEPKAPKK